MQLWRGGWFGASQIGVIVRKSFLPSRDALLLAFAQNFYAVGNPIATSIGLSTAAFTAFNLLVTAYATALAACAPGVRNKAATQTKKSARAALVASARSMAKIVEATPGVTNTQKAQLQLTIKSGPTPVPVPSAKPLFDITSVIGRTVKGRVHAADTESRAFPKGCKSAFLYAYVGPTQPTDLSAYVFQGSTTRTAFTLDFPSTVAGGASVWLRACWANPRDQTGPASDAVQVYLQGAASVAA